MMNNTMFLPFIEDNGEYYVSTINKMINIDTNFLKKYFAIN